MEMPIDRCPSCDYQLRWSDTNTDLICHNIDCNAKNGRKLLHFFQVLDNLDGFGTRTIERLIECGYDTILDIYRMDIDEFRSCAFGPTQSVNLSNELDQSRKRPLPDYRFLAALGIENLGVGSSKKLLEKYTLEEVINGLHSKQLSCVDGFGYVTSESISFDLLDPRVKEIYGIGFNIVEEKIEVKESSITGKRVCFTGKMSGNRKEMELNAQKLGATVGAVNAKTDYLITGENVGANKTNAALKHGVKILTEQDYYNLIGE